MPQCTACYDEAFGIGYDAYFDAKEAAFARVVGGYWSNFAASRNPSVRTNSDLEADHVETGEANRGLRPPVRLSLKPWPAANEGGIVLDADEERGSKWEKQLHDNVAFCKLWDANAAAARVDSRPGPSQSGESLGSRSETRYI